MAKRIRIEVDKLPKSFFDESKDWSDLSISSIFSIPLFFEMPDRNIGSTIIKSCTRMDEYNWELEIFSSKASNSGEKLYACDIAEQVSHVARKRSVSLALTMHIKRLEILSDEKIRITTIFPIAHLGRLLANPAFSIHKHICADSFNIGRRSIISDVSHLNKNYVIEISEHDIDGPVFCTESNFDISGPMTISVDKWVETTKATSSHVFNMDIVFVLLVPDHMIKEFASYISQHICRETICSAVFGMAIPAYHMVDIWKATGSKAIRRKSDEPCGSKAVFQAQGRPLYYSPFNGNREIAVALCDELERLFKTSYIATECSYDDLTSDRFKDQLRLFLISSLWPHPVSTLTPFAISKSAPLEFLNLYRKAVACEDLDAALSLAIDAESALNIGQLGIVPIAQVKGCMRMDRINFWWPPSGWAYLHNILQE